MLSIASKALATVHNFLSPSKEKVDMIGMETHAARLASFRSAQASGRKRASSAKGSKAAKWALQDPSPEQLATAGFFFKPSQTSPDNVQCFSCHKDLDGWEPDDDPASEHIAFSPDCAWALQIAIEQAVGGEQLQNEDSMSERLLEARKATFGDAWPHEKKKGWGCKVQKMAEAGWYYCPSAESDDFAKCAYCGLCLDGWEPKDKPLNEHQRRSPDCAFFAKKQSKPAATKGRKGRPSKASRLSTQSTATLAGDDQPLLDALIDPNETVMSTATNISLASTASKAKRPGRPKKAPVQAKTRNTRAKVADSQQASSMIEPEDDTFDVKVQEQPTRATRGRKRTSDQMQEDATDIIEPPPKRATRTRSSTVKPASRQASPPQEDITMADVEETSAPPVKKGGRKRASSRARKTSTRKASNQSTASKASLRAAIPADEEIDAQLEADLERFSTDGEENWQVLGVDSSIMLGTQQQLRMPRTRLSVQKHTSVDILGNVNSSILSYPELDQELNSSRLIDSVQAPPKPPAPEKPKGRPPKKGKKATSSRVVSQETAVEETPPLQEFMEIANIHTQNDDTQPSSKTVEESQPLPFETQPTSQDESAIISKEGPDTSQLTMTTAADDSGHETDGSLLTSDKAKCDSKKSRGTTRKGKAAKKTSTRSKKASEASNTENQVSESHEPEPESIPVEAPLAAVKTKKAAKAKSKKDSVKTKKDSIPKQVDSEAAQDSHPQEDQASAEVTQAAPQSPPSVEIRLDEPQAPTPVLAPPTRDHIPSPEPSPQSSDAENHPPSSRPSQTRPPLARYSPSEQNRTVRVPLAATTPTGTPSRRNAKLQTSYPWKPVDLDYILLGTPGADKENANVRVAGKMLSAEEKKLSVEDWIKLNARKGEEKLRLDCERIVGKFESEGVRALKSLEGIACSD